VDLVVLAEVRWGYFRTRKQFLLSRFPAHWRVFYAQPPGSGSDDPWTPRREGNVTYFTVPFLKPDTKNDAYNALASTAPGRAAIEWAAGTWLRSRLRILGVESRPVVMTSNIYAWRALSRLPRKLLFYDFNDHPLQFASVPAWARSYWRAALDQVDALFVVSEYYRRALRAETDKPLVLLGNGAEVAHFENAQPMPEDLARLPRPRIGYVGLLSHFLDFDTLEAVRRARGAGTLVLIGPGSPDTEARIRELSAREGVAVLGERPYQRVPAYMQGLDVGLIPFRANDPYVQGINPNKVYQYLAAGLPVVTTPLLDLTPNPPHLMFAGDPAGTVEAVRAALETPADREARRALARPYDWDALAARMVGEIESRLAAAS
jgi:glycosyltransferase involved in cell wall biosynthesis